MSVALIMAGIQAGSLVLNGLNNKKHSKKLAKIQKDIAGMQYSYNKKQITEATETNLRGTLKQYAGAREDLYSEKEKARMQLNFTSQMKGTEKEDNSYMVDSNNKLNSEFKENLRTLLENQKNDLYNISKTGIGQLFQTTGDYNANISNINNVELKAKQEADKMITDGIMKAVTSGFGAMSGMDGIKNMLGTNRVKEIAGTFQQDTGINSPFITPFKANNFSLISPFNQNKNFGSGLSIL